MEVVLDLDMNYVALTKWIYATMSTPKPAQPKANKSVKASKPDNQALECQNRAMQKELEMRKK